MTPFSVNTAWKDISIEAAKVTMFYFSVVSQKHSQIFFLFMDGITRKIAHSGQKKLGTPNALLVLERDMDQNVENDESDKISYGMGRYSC